MYLEDLACNFDVNPHWVLLLSLLRLWLCRSRFFVIFVPFYGVLHLLLQFGFHMFGEKLYAVSF